MNPTGDFPIGGDRADIPTGGDRTGGNTPKKERVGDYRTGDRSGGYHTGGSTPTKLKPGDYRTGDRTGGSTPTKLKPGDYRTGSTPKKLKPPKGYNFEVQNGWTEKAINHPKHLKSSGGTDEILPIHNLTPRGGNRPTTVNPPFDAKKFPEDMRKKLHRVWPSLEAGGLGEYYNMNFWRDEYLKSGTFTGMKDEDFMSTCLTLHDKVKGWDTWKKIKENQLVKIKDFVKELRFNCIMILSRANGLSLDGFDQVPENVYVLKSLKFRVDDGFNFLDRVMVVKGNTSYDEGIDLDHDLMMVPNGTVKEVFENLVGGMNETEVDAEGTSGEDEDIGVVVEKTGTVLYLPPSFHVSFQTGILRYYVLPCLYNWNITFHISFHNILGYVCH